jgi:hypothetical protein
MLNIEPACSISEREIPSKANHQGVGVQKAPGILAVHSRTKTCKERVSSLSPLVKGLLSF